MARAKQLTLTAEPAIASVAALIGDPARAAMLCALLDGEERAAKDLAKRGGVAPNAASAHLAKLVAGGLLKDRRAGRSRLFRLADPHVARALESLALVAAPVKIVALSQARASVELRRARRCYDHLAGQLGVAVTDALLAHGYIVKLRDEAFRVLPAGAAFFASLGIDVASLRTARRAFARQCVDWTERRPHLAGALGAALCSALLERKLVLRQSSGRALTITAAGEHWFATTLGIEHMKVDAATR